MAACANFYCGFSAIGRLINVIIDHDHTIYPFMTHIAGPSFTAELPFEWQTGINTTAPSDWELVRYLMVLADFEQGGEVLELAQAKQDLLLLWLAKSQTICLPDAQVITVGMDQIHWHSSHVLSIGEQGWIKLAFSSQFPLLISVPARISDVQQDGSRWRCLAELTNLSPLLLDHFEQTVFRYHRRAIQHAKHKQ
jgi:hypothetical protein